MFAVSMLAPVLSGMLQASTDVLTNPIVVALLSLIAVPAVGSFVTTLLIKAGASGIKPQTVVYVVSAVIVTAIALMAGGLPAVDAANPSLTFGAWMAYVAGLGKLTEALYDVLWKRLWPSPDVPTP